MTKPHALFLTPEPPYPMMGGGALRSASLLEYLMERYAVEALTFRQPGAAAPLWPDPRLRLGQHLRLPYHSRSAPARAWRNFRRYLIGSPPLWDRFARFSDWIDSATAGRHYALGVIEHFWCASYAAELRGRCRRLVLDLHNVESVLHYRLAGGASWPSRLALRSFARDYRRLERHWLPRFDLILTASEDDAALVRELAPDVPVSVYPNALPLRAWPSAPERHAVVFSGNLEYAPNVEAVRWFNQHVWPRVRAADPTVEWRLVGMNPQGVAPFLRGAVGVQLVGPVGDAVEAIGAGAVVVVPLRSGSGTRFKILEAWAARRAVVSTTLGAEGLGAQPGQHLVIEDDPTRFADAVVQLLRNPDQRQHLGSQGRALLEEKFVWPAAWQALEGL